MDKELQLVWVQQIPICCDYGYDGFHSVIQKKCGLETAPPQKENRLFKNNNLFKKTTIRIKNPPNCNQ